MMLVPAFVMMMAGCGGFVDGPDGPFLVERKTPSVATVAGAFSFSGDGETATFMPDSPLFSNARYLVILKPEITDLSGNALVVDPVDGEIKWDFFTGP